MQPRFPDTSVFEGKYAEEFYGWSCEIRAKLKADAECYATAEEAVLYITLRCKGEAALKMAKWTPMAEVNTRDEMIEAVLGYLEKAFGEPCRRSKAVQKLLSDEFRQGGKPFWKFRREFESTWDRSGRSDTSQKVWDFSEKLSDAMRESMGINLVTEENYDKFVEVCGRVANRVEDRRV